MADSAAPRGIAEVGVMTLITRQCFAIPTSSGLLVPFACSRLSRDGGSEMTRVEISFAIEGWGGRGGAPFVPSRVPFSSLLAYSSPLYQPPTRTPLLVFQAAREIHVRGTYTDEYVSTARYRPRFASVLATRESRDRSLVRGFLVTGSFGGERWIKRVVVDLFRALQMSVTPSRWGLTGFRH